MARDRKRAKQRRDRRGRETTQAAPTKGQIEAQISACTQWNYIAEDQAGRLSSTRRVDDELEFLKAIANPGADIGHGVSRR